MVRIRQLAIATLVGVLVLSIVGAPASACTKEEFEQRYGSDDDADTTTDEVVIDNEASKNDESPPRQTNLVGTTPFVSPV